MSIDHRERLKNIRTFPSLVKYLRDELGWPIETDDFEELTFEYTPEELGIDTKNAAKIQDIKRLRPLSVNQPWGIFFVKFEPKRLPVVALRRILSRVVVKKRASANSAERAAWHTDDLLFVSNYGEGRERRINFAHFSQDEMKSKLPTLRVLGWDNLDTALHLDNVAEELRAKLTWPKNENDINSWRQIWRSAFSLRHREVITTSKNLAVRLAELARAIRDRIDTVMDIETEDGPTTKLMKAFQEALIHDLDANGFADMYAQTIAYGLLSTRIAAPDKKTTDDFAAHLRTNPFLKQLLEAFLRVGGRRGKADKSGIDFDELGVSEVVELLEDANMEAIIRDFGDRNPQEDPVIHFYEDFLAAYDKKQKVRLGVFYTPQPVVSFIVRSVDELLRVEFGLEDGLADTTTWSEMAKRQKEVKIPKTISPDQAFVQILDPATGTGTFLVEVIDLIHNTMVKKWMTQGRGKKEIQSLWNEYVPKHLLTRLHGYELLMAPYAIAHLKIGLKLYETGYRFGSNERARVYLTNALEPASKNEKQLEFQEFLPAIAYEAQAVNKIKHKQRFTTIVGNPPYARLSENYGVWISQLMRDYYEINGEPLGERNPKNLQDDYVKFIRLGQFLIEETECGVLGFITNHGFIVNPTFRGMRHSLLSTFDNLRILNLHGNSKSGERPTEITEDGNVFDIQQGVAISIYQRFSNEKGYCTVGAQDLWGTREDKYAKLDASKALDLPLSSVKPTKPFFLFTIQNEDLDNEYRQFASLKEIMPVSSAGFVTSRDNFVIAFRRDELLRQLHDIADKNVSEHELKARYGRGRLPSSLRKTFSLRDNPNQTITQCEFRPFDRRYIIYAKELLERPRVSFFKNLQLSKNIALLSARTNKSASMDHFFCTRLISERKCAEASTGSAVFPLFISDGTNELFSNSQREPNFSNVFLRSLSERICEAVSQTLNNCLGGSWPFKVFCWIYGICHSAIYRSRYAEFLKIDFPRIPLPKNVDMFTDLSRLGVELVALHLMDSPKLDDLITTYSGPTNPKIGKVGWSDGTVWLDASKTSAREGNRATKLGTISFEGVPEEVWDFNIGGYQVCHKWLKDRKSRTLLKAELVHYQKIIVALKETIRTMKKIDGIIEEYGGWPGAFQN